MMRHRIDVVLIGKVAFAACSCGWSGEAPRGTGELNKLCEAHRNEMARERLKKTKAKKRSPS
jgi:hypothetical protein